MQDFPTARSKIGPVTIRESVVATAEPGDGFGIMAEQVTSVKVATANVSLKPGTANDNLLIDAASDLRVKEV